MKKFEQALLEAEKQNSLKRVKLKLDPKIREAQDYSQYEGYEGYVLSETETHVELQINNKRVTLPKMVLENKLLDFIKGVAPKTYESGKRAVDKVKDSWQYANDPKVFGAERFGRRLGAAGSAVGGLTNAAFKAANPMTYLRGIERVATAPARLVGNLMGIDTKGSEKAPRVDYGAQTSFVVHLQEQQQMAAKLESAANAINQGHTVQSNAGAKVGYYSIDDKDNRNKTLENYVVIKADILTQHPGLKYSSKQRMPISSIRQHSNKIMADVAALKKAPKNPNSPTVDASFFASIHEVTDQLNRSIENTSIDKKVEYVLTILHLESLTEFEISGWLTQKFTTNKGYGFILSEKYA